MDTTLTLENVVVQLVRAVYRDFDWQITQVDHPDYGGLFAPDSGLASASHGGTLRFIMVCGLLAHLHVTQPGVLPDNAPDADTLLQRMDIACDFALKAQRPSGLTDLLSTNFDSSPDTGFNVELMCALTDVARGTPSLAANLAKVETFIRRAVEGMKTGGFHTPNHRWVITSALTQAARLFPDLDVSETVNAYLREGFDADEEGAYIERSVGIYDTVSNRALLFIAENWPDDETRQSALDAVTRNLEFDLHLLHPDGSAETGLSRRQDYGTRAVPLALIMPLMVCGKITGNDRFIKAAQWLWARAHASNALSSTAHGGERVVDAHWHTYALLKYGTLPQTQAEIPANYVRYYPRNQIWRVRDSDISASVFGSVTRLMTLVYGQVTLSSVKINHAYFGVGKFIAETMAADDSSVTLHSSGVQHPHKPGYELPLGRPVDPDQWDDTFAERDYRPLPPAESTLTVTVVDGGFDFHFQSLKALDGVPVQIALDFPAGGVWETDDTALVTAPGLTIFLKSGTGTLRFGSDVIHINGGKAENRYFEQRHSEPVPHDHVRVLLAFLTPVDHRFSLRLSHGWSG